MINIQIIDYLSDKEIISDKIILKTKAFSRFTNITNTDKTIRFEVNYENGQWIEEEPISNNNMGVNILQL